MGVGNILEYAGFIDSYFEQDIIQFYAFLAISGIMIMTIVMSIAALRLPRIMSGEYAAAYFHLPKWVLYSLCIISVFSSLGILMGILVSKLLILWIYIVIIGLITALYLAYSKNMMIR